MRHLVHRRRASELVELLVADVLEPANVENERNEFRNIKNSHIKLERRKSTDTSSSISKPDLSSDNE